MEDRVSCADQLFPIAGGGVGGLGGRQASLGQRRGVIAGLRVLSLAALALLDEDRNEDGLQIIGVHLEQTAGRAERLVGVAQALIGVDQLVENRRLDDTLRVGFKETFQGRGLGCGIALLGSGLIAVELGRILDGDRILGSQHGRENKAEARQCHHGR